MSPLLRDALKGRPCYQLGEKEVRFPRMMRGDYDPRLGPEQFQPGADRSQSKQVRVAPLRIPLLGRARAFYRGLFV